ncbi:MAG: DUF6232 family protein [Oscillatoria sp. PMC 1051.18]|nr:DUF6232 family protein [Oscillatoria sp. PMC 1050.18]MEC5029852.1 DUF6232 family protein [Oscillatoria sp. PMC 1051.18]
MVPNNMLQNNQNVSFEKAKYINITKRTVKFGADVYLFRNVTGFGLYTPKKFNIIPIPIIGALFLFGLGLASFEPTMGWGILLLLLGIGAIVLNVSQPDRYGFELVLNSGDHKVFETHDLNGIRTVADTLYKFMESNEEGGYTINIQDKSITIGENATGTFNTGDKFQGRS